MKTRWNSVEGVPRRCVARSNGWQKKNKTTKNKKNKKNKKKEKNNKTICVSRTPSPTGSGVESQQQRTAIVVRFFFYFVIGSPYLFFLLHSAVFVCEKNPFFFVIIIIRLCIAMRMRPRPNKRRHTKASIDRKRPSSVVVVFFSFFSLPSFLPLCLWLFLSFFPSVRATVCVCVCVCCYCGGRLVRHSGAPIVGWMSPFIGSNSRKKMIINPKFGPCYPLVTRRTPVFVVRVVPKFRAEFFFVGWVGFVFDVIDV